MASQFSPSPFRYVHTCSVAKSNLSSTVFSSPAGAEEEQWQYGPEHSKAMPESGHGGKPHFSQVGAEEEQEHGTQSWWWLSRSLWQGAVLLPEAQMKWLSPHFSQVLVIHVFF